MKTISACPAAISGLPPGSDIEAIRLWKQCTKCGAATSTPFDPLISGDEREHRGTLSLCAPRRVLLANFPLRAKRDSCTLGQASSCRLAVKQDSRGERSCTKRRELRGAKRLFVILATRARARCLMRALLSTGRGACRQYPDGRKPLTSPQNPWYIPQLRGVAQRLARMVWDHEAGGSNPLTPTSIALRPRFPEATSRAPWLAIRFAVGLDSPRNGF